MQVYAYDPYNMGSNVPIAVTPGYPGQPIPVQAVQMQPMAGQIRFGGVSYIITADPMADLEVCQSVIIKQQPEFFEMLTGCETANRYHILANCNGAFKYLFKCIERSSCCMRACCPSKIREFNMDIFHAISSPITGQMTNNFANAFKPLKIPCFCCNRPEILVTLKEGNKYIGKIKHAFTFCDPEFEVYDSQGLKYFVNADCCQCGLLCANNFCGKLSTATFEIYQPGTSNVIATISKMSAQSYSEIVTDADSYEVKFPPGATAEDKLLLISLGLMIDYQYFETDSSSNNGMGRRNYGYRLRY